MRDRLKPERSRAYWIAVGLTTLAVFMVFVLALYGIAIWAFGFFVG